MYKALTLPLLITLFLHGLILAIILIDAPESAPMVKRATPSYIRAELITLEKPKAKKPDKPKAKPKPVATPKAEPKKDQARDKQLALEKQQKEQQRQQQATKVEQQKKALEQRKIEEQQRLRREADKEFAEAIEQELVYAQALSDVELANSFIALITEAIQNNWNRPPSARNDMEAELLLQLVPTGEVMSVRIVKSSGSAAFDRSAETAVLKAGRFPELQKLPVRVFDQYFRRLTLKFKPEDLRL